MPHFALHVSYLPQVIPRFSIGFRMFCFLFGTRSSSRETVDSFRLINQAVSPQSRGRGWSGFLVSTAMLGCCRDKQLIPMDQLGNGCVYNCMLHNGLLPAQYHC
jgi:hypothetical protein